MSNRAPATTFCGAEAAANNATSGPPEFLCLIQRGQCNDHARQQACRSRGWHRARHECFAQSARDIRGPTPLVAIQDEAPAKLIVDPPIPEQLALGRVMIQYRTENLRILPVFGKGALNVSPRVGHLHYTVDDATWPIVDTSYETVVLVGLKPGPHKVRFELADPLHRAVPDTSQTVTFIVPDTASHSH